jgi:hypothetical protein
VEDEDSPAAKDPKLLRWLKTLGEEGGEAEELSVASKFSYNSDARYARQPRASPSSRRGLGGMDDLTMTDYSVDDSPNIPMSIQVSSSAAAAAASSHRHHHHQQQQQPRMGPGPVRVSAPFQQIMESPPPHHYPPPPAPAPASAAAVGMGTPPRHPSSLPSSAEKHRSPSAFLQTIEDHEASDHEVESSSSFPSDLNQQRGGLRARAGAAPQQPSPASSAASPHGDIAGAPSTLSDPGGYRSSSPLAAEDGPFIASMQELKKHASQRRSRNSILMKQRFRMSGAHNNAAATAATPPPDGAGAASFGGHLATKRSEEENNIPNAPSSSSGGGGGLFASPSPSQQPKSSSLFPSSSASVVSAAPEHMVIAIRLLRAHKAHVDQIMETLKMEMDTLRDFDRLLEEPGRPTEDECLDYFESVGLCLDQRLQAGQQLQREMDRISRGEPPQE